MQTIKSLIGEKRGSLSATRAIQLEDRMNLVYAKFPELKKIDVEIVNIRKEKIVAMIDSNDAPIPALDKRLEELYEDRVNFIKKNKIDPDFDEEQPVCMSCKDTGFVTTKGGIEIVCNDCMSDELIKCYNYCGLADYSMYTLKNYKSDYFGDKARRKKVFDSVKKVFENSRKENQGLYLYTDKVQSGKTFLSVILVKYAIIEGIGAAYVKAEEMADLDNDTMEFIKNCDFLVIDEYAAEITRSWIKASSINAVIEARNAAGLPTLLVSIYSKPELVQNSEVRLSGKIDKAVVV